MEKGAALVTRQVHILIIDDTPEGLSSVISALRGQQWHVSVCTDSRQGFHRAQALAPDLIMLDVYMRGMDGFATCRLLQASSRTCDIPIVFLTQAAADEQRLEGLQNGGVDYIVKPGLPAEVVARIRIHLRSAALTHRIEPTEAMPVLPQGEVMLRAAMRFIHHNLAELPPLTEIAHQVGTHDKKLSAIFRQQMGMTVFAWVREERLRRAREWLADSEMNVRDIATQVGFRSAANFATAFRKRMGVSPSQYRENQQQADVGPCRNAP